MLPMYDCRTQSTIAFHIEWPRHSFFYFQPEPVSFFSCRIHSGSGRGSFGATFPPSQPGHFGFLFLSSSTRNARPQSLHSYWSPGIFSHLRRRVLNIQYSISAALFLYRQQIEPVHDALLPSQEGRSRPSSTQMSDTSQVILKFFPPARYWLTGREHIRPHTLKHETRG